METPHLGGVLHILPLLGLHLRILSLPTPFQYRIGLLLDNITFTSQP